MCEKHGDQRKRRKCGRRENKGEKPDPSASPKQHPFTEHTHALTVSASLVLHLFTNNIFLLLDMAESSI